jgi:drug/metabolite transporter (DMT)-like permease
MTWASRARLAALAVIWGSSFLFIKAALAGLSPIQVLLGRLSLGAIVLLTILAVRRQSLPAGRATWAHLTVAAVVANAIPYLLFAWAEQRVASNLAGVLNATTPLFTVLIALATGTERAIGRSRAAGLAAGFLGTLLILAPWRQAGAGAVEGQIACLAAAASYGVAYVYVRRFIARGRISPLALSTGQLGIAAILTGPVAAFTGRQAITPTPTVLAAITALGALGTGVAYLLNYRLIADEGATAASLVTYLLPPVAVLDGVVVLGEPAGWNLVLGTAVVLVGVALSQRPMPAGPTPAEAVTVPR